MLKDFINLLFLKPEEGFKEIYESINILESNASNFYFASFKNSPLDVDIEKSEEEINKIKELINNILKENEDTNIKIIINLLRISLLTLLSFILIFSNLPHLLTILLFLINFFMAYRFAYLSESFNKIVERDRRNSKITLNELPRIENILQNTKRNILKRNNIKNESTKNIVLFNKAQEVLNNYFDNNIILPMDSNTIMYLIKMLQGNLNTKEVDLSKLLEMSKQNNNTITLKRTK